MPPRRSARTRAGGPRGVRPPRGVDRARGPRAPSGARPDARGPAGSGACQGVRRWSQPPSAVRVGRALAERAAHAGPGPPPRDSDATRGQRTRAGTAEHSQRRTGRERRPAGSRADGVEAPGRCGRRGLPRQAPARRPAARRRARRRARPPAAAAAGRPAARAAAGSPAGRGRRAGCPPRGLRSAGAAASTERRPLVPTAPSASPSPTAWPSRTDAAPQVQVRRVVAPVARADGDGQPRDRRPRRRTSPARRSPRPTRVPTGAAMSIPRCCRPRTGRRRSGTAIRRRRGPARSSRPRRVGGTVSESAAPSAARKAIRLMRARVERAAGKRERGFTRLCASLQCVTRALLLPVTFRCGPVTASARIARSRSRPSTRPPRSAAGRGFAPASTSRLTAASASAERSARQPPRAAGPTTSTTSPRGGASA